MFLFRAHKCLDIRIANLYKSLNIIKNLNYYNIIIYILLYIILLFTDGAYLTGGITVTVIWLTRF